MNKIKVGIVGHGFVGESIEHNFKEKAELFIVDPSKYPLSLDDLMIHCPAVVFICVPTPSLSDGSCDTSAVRYVVDKLIQDAVEKPLIVIKSTVTPDFFSDYLYNHRIVYEPEFLTQENHLEDARNPKMKIYGGSFVEIANLKYINYHYSLAKHCPEFDTDFKTASMLKYTINSFLATKVTFMNHVFEMFVANGMEEKYREFANIVANEPRIGKSHLTVPGNDGKYGFGGACFPKDTEAFIKYADGLGLDFKLLRTTVADNNRFRKK